MAGDVDVVDALNRLAPLHPRNDTFPGEVLLRLAADTLDRSGVDQAHPIDLDGMRERLLPDIDLRGGERRKLEFTILAAAALHGGVELDLLDEVTWWQTDDSGATPPTPRSPTCGSRPTAPASRLRGLPRPEPVREPDEHAVLPPSGTSTGAHQSTAEASLRTRASASWRRRSIAARMGPWRPVPVRVGVLLPVPPASSLATNDAPGS